MKKIIFVLLCLAVSLFLIGILTWRFAVRPPPDSLSSPMGKTKYAEILDRNGYLLSLTRQNRLNVNPIPLWQIPDLLVNSFILAEDKRFYSHHGVDWAARAKACWVNLKALRIVRGASTISEQCIRILHPRPRNLFSRWIETLEVYGLEKKFSKGEILEFYLNQVPFANQCRGIQDASLFYFDRTPDTLNTQEMLTLAVMVRAPGLLQPKKNENHDNAELVRRVLNLASLMRQKGLIPAGVLQEWEPWETGRSQIRTEASHFVRYVKNAYSKDYQTHPKLTTTLDSRLQQTLNGILQESLNRLKPSQVNNGAIIVLDQQTDEVLAWVLGKDFFSEKEGSQIDSVLTPRQPGSTLKPFLYAMALDQGFTAATIIADIPLSQPVGHGLHPFKNFSSQYYGPIRLRCALGNSLNIPAVRMVQLLGVAPFKQMLLQLGLRNLALNAEHYGDGLALGNGEISLYELVRAYAVLARSGIYREPKCLLAGDGRLEQRRIFSADASSLIANILSDSEARSLEFGESGLLDFPVQTAVKTGTSSDYRDAWAIGFNDRYTVGVWMGNLDYQPMSEITGSRGPALVLRSVFRELNKNRQTGALYLSPALRQIKICALSGMAAGPSCPQVVTEWFKPETIVTKPCNWHLRTGHRTVTRLPYEYRQWLKDSSACQGENVSFTGKSNKKKTASIAPEPLPGKRVVPVVRLAQPVPELHVALDPRIPDHLEKFAFIVESLYPICKIEWFLDGRLLTGTGPDLDRYLWHPIRGRHTVYAKVMLKKRKSIYRTRQTPFWVK